jgi:ATP:corrinoid adenosyltransferase
MGITMKANSLYLKKMGKGFINGKIKRGIRGSLGVIILLASVGLSILIMNFMKGKSPMVKERGLGSIVIPMGISSEVSGRMMRS